MAKKLQNLEKKQKSGFIIVNGSTGEITDTLYVGDTILHGKPDDNMVRDFNKGVLFHKHYINAMKVLLKELTTTEFGLATALSIKSEFKTAIVLNEQGKPATIIDLATELGYKPDTLRKTLVKFFNLGIIAKITVANLNYPKNSFIFNPYVCHNGKDVHKFVVDLFEDCKVTKILKESV